MSEGRWAQGMGATASCHCVVPLRHDSPATNSSELRLIWVKGLAHPSLGEHLFLRSFHLAFLFLLQNEMIAQQHLNWCFSKTLCFRYRYSVPRKLSASLTSQFSAFGSWLGHRINGSHIAWSFIMRVLSPEWQHQGLLQSMTRGQVINLCMPQSSLL